MDLIIQWTVTTRLENRQKNVKLHKIMHFKEKISYYKSSKY
jgi:hypothetical protein